MKTENDIPENTETEDLDPAPQCGPGLLSIFDWLTPPKEPEQTEHEGADTD